MYRYNTVNPILNDLIIHNYKIYDNNEFVIFK